MILAYSSRVSANSRPVRLQNPLVKLYLDLISRFLSFERSLYSTVSLALDW